MIIISVSVFVIQKVCINTLYAKNQRVEISLLLKVVFTHCFGCFNAVFLNFQSLFGSIVQKPWTRTWSIKCSSEECGSMIRVTIKLQSIICIHGQKNLRCLVESKVWKKKWLKSNMNSQSKILFYETVEMDRLNCYLTSSNSLVKKWA